MDTKSLLKFHNKEVIVRFVDDKFLRKAEGVMIGIGEGFVKIKGEKGTIVINQESIKEVNPTY